MDNLREFYSDTGPERCGVILKDGTVVETDNLSPEPDMGFEIPIEILIDVEADLEATWHTHPNDTANLSADDTIGFLNWPNIKHYIVGKDETACYVVKNKYILRNDLQG